jgi:hypothetical protein
MKALIEVRIILRIILLSSIYLQFICKKIKIVICKNKYVLFENVGSPKKGKKEKKKKVVPHNMEV